MSESKKGIHSFARDHPGTSVPGQKSPVEECSQYYASAELLGTAMSDRSFVRDVRIWKQILPTKLYYVK